MMLRNKGFHQQIWQVFHEMQVFEWVFNGAFNLIGKRNLNMAELKKSSIEPVGIFQLR